MEGYKCVNERLCISVCVCMCVCIHKPLCSWITASISRQWLCIIINSETNIRALLINVGVHIVWNEAEFQTFKITPGAVAGSLNSSVLPWMTACFLILKELMLIEWSLPLGWGLRGWRILFQPLKNNFSKSVFVTPFVWASECEASFGDGLPCPLPRGLCCCWVVSVVSDSLSPHVL